MNGVSHENRQKWYINSWGESETKDAQPQTPYTRLYKAGITRAHLLYTFSICVYVSQINFWNTARLYLLTNADVWRPAQTETTITAITNVLLGLSSGVLYFLENNPT